MKIFLIIVGLILVSKLLEFALAVICLISERKKLQERVSSLQAELNDAREIIYENNKFMEMMKRYKDENMVYRTSRNISKDEIEAVRYAMKKAHPDNGGSAEDFMRFKKCYEELTRKRG